MEEIRKAYNKLVKNRLYRDEMRPYLLTEVREYALQISMRRLDLWDKFCQVESNVKQALPVAKKVGFDNVLSYYLARDEEYNDAEAVISLIDNGIAIEDNDLPPLPDCFKDERELWRILNIPKVEDLYTLNDGKYYLQKDKKTHLAALAHRLLSLGKFKDFITTGQDLARVFCPFFNVTFNKKYEYSFKKSKSELIDFDNIK